MTVPKRGSFKKRQEKRTQTQICRRDEAHEADRSYRAFLANLRSELRTPVNAIIEYSGMLLEDAKKQVQENFMPDLRKINALGRKLLTLVDERMDETKIDTAVTEKELEDFSAHLRHELRTPLNAIIGYSEMLIEDAAAEGQKGFIPTSKRSALLANYFCLLLRA